MKIPSVLALALQTRAAVSGSRDSRSDSADEQRQPTLGCTANPRRAAQARHRDQPSYRREVHDTQTGNTFSELADLPEESRRGHRYNRYVRCGIRVVSVALREMIILAHDRRNIVLTAVTEHPTAAWLSRQVTEAFPWDTAPRYLLCDRDASYGSDFRSRVEAMGITEVITAPRSPWQNAYVERMIGSIRRECLDHIVIFNERHLRRVLSSLRRLLPTHPHSSFARQRLSGSAPDPAAQGRGSRRHPKSRRLASSLRTSRRLIRSRFLLSK